jgi:hypothetical protein
MHKITKDEARQFIDQDGSYRIIESTKLTDFSCESEDPEPVYFPVPKHMLIEHLTEEDMVWNKDLDEVVMSWDDWEEALDFILDNDEAEKRFIDFCKARDIDYTEWVSENER